MFSASQEIPRI